MQTQTKWMWQQVDELAEAGYSAKAIAEKLDTSIMRVYRLRHYANIKNGRSGFGARPGSKFTEVERATARAHGISRELMYARLNRGWEREKLITTPPADLSRSELIERAIANGINPNTYYRRVRRGIDPEDAATLAKVNGMRRQARSDGRTIQERIKAEEGRATLQEVAEKYDMDPMDVEDIWRYFV